MPQIMTETGHRTHCSYLFLRSRKPKLTTRGPYKCPASPECANGISLGQTWRWNQRICTGTNMFFRPFLWLYIDSCQMVSVGCPQVLNFTRLVGGGANSSNKHESRDWDIMISSFHLSWYRDLKQTRNINNYKHVETINQQHNQHVVLKFPGHYTYLKYIEPIWTYQTAAMSCNLDKLGFSATENRVFPKYGYLMLM